MKKILITGSTGFLGSRLAYYLKDRYELLLPTHAELRMLADLAKVGNTGPEQTSLKR